MEQSPVHRRGVNDRHNPKIRLFACCVLKHQENTVGGDSFVVCLSRETIDHSSLRWRGEDVKVFVVTIRISSVELKYQPARSRGCVPRRTPENLFPRKSSTHGKESRRNHHKAMMRPNLVGAIMIFGLQLFQMLLFCLAIMVNGNKTRNYSAQ